jgi:TctA family transporter
MDVIASLLGGFERALTLEALFFCFVGVTVGTFVGVLPGIGALAAISLSLPLTYYLDPMIALIMLSGIFYGTQYGSSTSAILLNIPGTPAAAITCLEGYPLARQGRAGVALFITAVSSFVGGSIGIVLLMAFTPALAAIAIGFSSADYFSLILFCLVGTAMLGIGSPLKGLCMVAVGLLLGMVGIDVSSGQARFTLGIVALTDGINLVAMMMGLFGVAEILQAFATSGSVSPLRPGSISLRSLLPDRKDIREATMPTIRGSLVGSIVGVLPGMGATLGTFIAYGLEKRVSRTPEKFGNGAIAGIASPEASNNASVQTAFIPTMGIGIPGDAVMAVLIGALMIHGIQPGPLFMVQQADLFWGVVASMWIGNVLLLVLNIPLIGIWVRILAISPRVLYPTVLVLVCIGVYSVNNNVFDVFATIIFGLVGYSFGLFGYPMASLVLGFILSPLLEEHLRRSLLISDGNYMVFLQRPISGTFIALTALVVLLSFRQKLLSFVFGRPVGDLKDSD